MRERFTVEFKSSTLSIFSTFDNMLKLTMSPQARRAETDPCQSTPTVGHTYNRPTFQSLSRSCRSCGGRPWRPSWASPRRSAWPPPTRPAHGIRYQISCIRCYVHAHMFTFIICMTINTIIMINMHYYYYYYYYYYYGPRLRLLRPSSSGRYGQSLH